MSTFHILIAATIAFDALLLGVLVWAFHSPRFAPYRFVAKARLNAKKRTKVMLQGFNSIASPVSALSLIWLVETFVLTDTSMAPWWIALQAFVILALYDFIYYFMHRGMHHRQFVRYVHAVHHKALHPSALESLFLHPLEMVAGLALLGLATFLVSLVTPVHPIAFAASFFVYSTLNLLVHSGIDFPYKVLEPINFLTRKHQVHHGSDSRKNYSSLTPFPDLLFGTASE